MTCANLIRITAFAAFGSPLLLAPVAMEGGATSSEVTPFVSRDTTITMRIHDSLPPYHFTLIHDPELGAVQRILVTRGDEERPLQSLTGFPEPKPAPDGHDDAAVVDINFDGYRDLRLLGGATGNRSFLWWLFHPGTGKFAYAPALADMGNPIPDPATRTIRTRASRGMAGQVFTEGTYAWEGGAPLLVHQVRQDWSEARKAFVRTVAKRVNGALRPVRHGLVFAGEVSEGERFTFDLMGNLYFELDPDPEGWEIAVRATDRPGENLARLTPPLYGPNPRQIWGWHFRNADNTGPNDGSVNAPQMERPFIFSEKVGRSIQGPGSVRGPTVEDLDAVERDGGGTLTIEDLRLGNLTAGQRPRVQWMRFTVTVDFP
jgi:hypothetical protein